MTPLVYWLAGAAVGAGLLGGLIYTIIRFIGDHNDWPDGWKK